ncbi:cell division protein [Novosphingobium sp. SL115]|uniref:cell division protein FtsX n=1 Tax=Novosphingobium sp. SL115 TaxID=2995150 RepID=UPI0022745EBC|nr:cell division protein [Novosphingobium sp. SL115]MCY1670919.1 cell division protein [Novosphingobium sp. SL115]
MSVFPAIVSGLRGDWRDRASAESRLLPQGKLSGPMPWVIAIMIGLTVLATASGLALRNTARAASADLAGGATVQIVHGAPRERDRQAQAALASLKQAPGVISARLVPQAELDALVEPWLGTNAGDDIDALPVPALIDVRLSGHTGKAELAALRARLKTPAPAARVDAQASWLAPVFEAIGALQWLAGGLIALLAFATVAAVLLASRNALGNHRTTIEIVHMLGGTDAQIARIFQRSMAIDAAAGGIGGLLLGTLAIFLMGNQFAALGSGMMTSTGLVWTDWLVICAIPLAGVLLAVLTARYSVLSALRRML